MVNKHYQFSINTEILKIDSLPVELNRIVNFLKQNQVSQIMLIHGWVPDLEEEQGQDSLIHIDSLRKTIDDEILKGQIELGRVDLWIRNDEKEYQFQICNDADLHFYANEAHLISTIVEIWKKAGHQIYGFVEGGDG